MKAQTESSKLEHHKKYSYSPRLASVIRWTFELKVVDFFVTYSGILPSTRDSSRQIASSASCHVAYYPTWRYPGSVLNTSGPTRTSHSSTFGSMAYFSVDARPVGSERWSTEESQFMGRVERRTSFCSAPGSRRVVGKNWIKKISTWLIRRTMLFTQLIRTITLSLSWPTISCSIFAANTSHVRHLPISYLSGSKKIGDIAGNSLVNELMLATRESEPQREFVRMIFPMISQYDQMSYSNL